ncbi:hypothetical protein GF420_08375 [candidate division GN15 bacterium]|nr:hypothetical protein [candidate division GN15 bacterium]
MLMHLCRLMWAATLVSTLAGSVIGAPSLDEYPMRFAILSDRTGGHVPGVHGQIAEEIQQLRPDFVVTVGDMIEGYHEDSIRYEREWDEYFELVSPLTMPIYYTPGNHDVLNELGQRIYQRRVGKLDYTFERRAVQFVVFDNSRWNHTSELPDERINWLADALAATDTSRMTLLFMHRPFWYETVAAGYPDTLHSLCVANGVDAVFTGHHHRYFVGTYDGVRYTGMGSSGGGMWSDSSLVGYHFAWVTVTADDLTVTPINAGAVKPWDIITADDRRVTEMLDRAGLSLSRSAFAGDDLSVPRQEVSLIVRNLSPDRELRDTLKLDVPRHWQVTPATTDITVAPADSTVIAITLEAEPICYPLPTLSLDFPFGDGKSHRVTGTMQVARQAVAYRAVPAPEIDGDVVEHTWQSPQTYFIDSDRQPAQTDSTAIFFAYDDRNLYIAARCHDRDPSRIRSEVDSRDGAVYGDDCVGFFLQPDRRDSTIYQIYVNPAGVFFDQLITADSTGYFTGDRSWDGEYEVAARTDGHGWSMELRIPLAVLGVASPPEESWALNMRRKQPGAEASGNWQSPIEYTPRGYGRLLFD